MGLNKPCKSGDQAVGSERESREAGGAPTPFRHGLLSLVNVMRRKGGGERREHEGLGTTWDSCCHPYPKSASWLLGVVTVWGIYESLLRLWNSDLEISLLR